MFVSFVMTLALNDKLTSGSLAVEPPPFDWNA